MRGTQLAELSPMPCNRSRAGPAHHPVGPAIPWIVWNVVPTPSLMA